MRRVVGMGSPLGDDQAGLEVARRLRIEQPETQVIEADRPGAGLVELLSDCDELTLVDAVQATRIGPGAERQPGRIVACPLRELRTKAWRPSSSHDLSLADVVELTAELGRLPVAADFIGIEIGDVDVSQFDASLSPAVDVAVNAVVRRLSREPGGERRT